MADSIAVLITKPPYGTEDAFAGLRLALAMIASGIVEKTSVLLIGDGTLNAVASQQAEAIEMPSNVEAIQDILDFDVPVYCAYEDLAERAGDVVTIDGVKMVNWVEARSIISQHQLVTTF